MAFTRALSELLTRIRNMHLCADAYLCALRHDSSHKKYTKNHYDQMIRMYRMKLEYNYLRIRGFNLQPRWYFCRLNRRIPFYITPLSLYRSMYMYIIYRNMFLLICIFCYKWVLNCSESHGSEKLQNYYYDNIVLFETYIPIPIVDIFKNA